MLGRAALIAELLTQQIQFVAVEQNVHVDIDWI